MDLDTAKQRVLFDVARDAWVAIGRPAPYLATSFWFALGPAAAAREQVKRHLSRYLNWIPAEYVEAIAPTTGWAGSRDELAAQLREFQDIGADEIHLIPTSSDINQVREVAEIVEDFQ